MKILRIVFCVLACLFAAASMVIGMIFGLMWFLIIVACAGIFVILMFLTKQKSEPQEPPRPDFMNSDEENAKINSENNNPSERD